MSERIKEALQYIDCNDREIWIMVGMAIKFELGEDGFDIWDRWSQRGETYDPQALRACWRSFKGAGITVLSLYKEAVVNGWKPAGDDDRSAPTLTAEQLEQARLEREGRLAREQAQRDEAQCQAARKAAWILGQCKHERHAYLQSKGWPEASGTVWWPEPENNLLCIPMRVGNELVGVQMINRRGEKKYLKNARTSGAEFVISNGGPGVLDWWVEGYATGLSLRDCLNALKQRYRIHVCFSAGNLKKIATRGLVVADNDESGTGEAAAKAVGLPYFLPPCGDFNDLHQKVGTFRASQELRKWFVPVRKGLVM